MRPYAVSVGDYVFIGSHCHVESQVQIGNFVMLASYVSIVGGDHRMDVPMTPMIFAGRDRNRLVTIHDDVWVGHGVIIMHGVTIGEGAVVAAGSVVAKDVLPYSIVAGVPACVIGERFDGNGQREHREMLARYREDRKLKAGWHKAESYCRMEARDEGPADAS